MPYHLKIMTIKASAIERAIAYLGGNSGAARVMRVKPPTIHQWKSGARPVPAKRALEIERAAHGVVTCEDLRPDIDWSRPAAKVAA